MNMLDEWDQNPDDAILRSDWVLSLKPGDEIRRIHPRNIVAMVMDVAHSPVTHNSQFLVSYGHNDAYWMWEDSLRTNYRPGRTREQIEAS